jgi:hypothetical protein
MFSARDGTEISNDSAATHSAWFRMFMAVSLACATIARVKIYSARRRPWVR